MSEIAIQEQMTKTGQVGMGLKPRLMRWDSFQKIFLDQQMRMGYLGH
jgi:hypothetical protein